MRERARELEVCLDEAISLQENLLVLVTRQREAIVSENEQRVGEISGEIETEVLRLGGVESRRNTVAAELADELGLAAARWSALREGLEPDERFALAPLVERLEELVRDLELANAINGQLVRNELEIVDLSIRSLAGADWRSSTRAYSEHGGPAISPASFPMLLNTAA
jgi:predicted nuclease with TOPRIM domain